jgi:hypothetical protein
MPTPLALVMLPLLSMRCPLPPFNAIAAPLAMPSWAPACTLTVTLLEPGTLAMGVVCGLGAAAVQVTVCPVVGEVLSHPAQAGAVVVARRRPPQATRRLRAMPAARRERGGVAFMGRIDRSFSNEGNYGLPMRPP